MGRHSLKQQKQEAIVAFVTRLENRWPLEGYRRWLVP